MKNNYHIFGWLVEKAPVLTGAFSIYSVLLAANSHFNP